MKDQQEALKENRLNFVENLAEKLGATVNATYIYAEPVERGGVTVIPVAKASYGLGGGIRKKNTDEGGGGGGGVSLTPVGYIEIKNGDARFLPIRDWLAILPIIATTTPIILAGIWVMKRLLKRT